MSSDIAIKVENISKCFSIYHNPQDRLKQSIYPRLQRFFKNQTKQYYQEFWALKDVTFEVNKGETVGIIGRNGSGKSTLLQIICGILNPTSGSLHTNGRIAALLELGSGFNPEFTGRENVYMNAAILGLSQTETDSKLDNILAFADIGDFLDQPVKTYSSGMVVRLAFAVQAQVEPDILIVDEALAVGDAKFQAKCFKSLTKLKANGTSILLVTHSSEQVVNHCDHTILLDHGKEVSQGQPRMIVNRYMDLLFGKEPTKIINNTLVQESELENNHNVDSILSTIEDKFASRHGYNPSEYRWGDGAAKILDFYISADGEVFPSALEVGQKVMLNCSLKFLKDLINPIFGVTIKTKDGVTVYGINSEKTELVSFRETGITGQLVIVSIRFDCLLAPGDYFVSIGIASMDGGEVIPHDRRYDSIHLQVRPDNSFYGLVNLDCKLNVKDVI